MTSLECQSAVYDLAAEFFSRANINVARQNAAIAATRRSLHSTLV